MDAALVWDPVQSCADFVLRHGDLAPDDGLYTAALLSICSDRLANADDPLPVGTGDRRGTWMDTPWSDPGADAPDLAGSRLWLLTRAKQTQTNLNNGIRYLEESLAWMLADGVASSVIVSGAFPELGAVIFTVAIAQLGADGTETTQSWDFAWDATLGIVPVNPNRPVIVDAEGPVLIDSFGDVLGDGSGADLGL